MRAFLEILPATLTLSLDFETRLCRDLNVPNAFTRHFWNRVAASVARRSFAA